VGHSSPVSDRQRAYRVSRIPESDILLFQKRQHSDFFDINSLDIKLLGLPVRSCPGRWLANVSTGQILRKKRNGCTRRCWR
jgi:hypothetical protein